jgi:hypothetical protein
MSNDPFVSINPKPVYLQSNLRALKSDDFKLERVLHCRAVVGDDSETPSGEGKAVARAILKHLGKPEHVLSTIDKFSFFADPKDQQSLERDGSNPQFVLAVSCNGYGKSPAKFVDFDCASVCTSSIIFETTPSAFKRSLLPDGEWQWCRT